jgi:hypothetical protein
MHPKLYDVRRHFDRGAVMLSLDIEQIWGYLDMMAECPFRSRFPGAIEMHERMLTCLCEAGVSATWFVVGGMALEGSDGPRDLRLEGLPAEWTARIPAGTETTHRLWYRPSFVKLLAEAEQMQEIGLHCGLTHLIWTGDGVSRSVAERELEEGVRALAQAHAPPRSFSFGREQEVYYDLLPAHGIRCYRGRTAGLGHRLGPTLPGAVVRMYDELRCATPPPVWPLETLPGLWNIPSSMFLYPIAPSRTRVAGLRSRLDRFTRGIEAAARYRGIFHYSLHPENLTESADGFRLFEDMVERLAKARDRGDVEILTVGQAIPSAENQSYASQKQPSNA